MNMYIYIYTHIHAMAPSTPTPALSLRSYADVLEGDLAKELHNGRLLRLAVGVPVLKNNFKRQCFLEATPFK